MVKNKKKSELEVVGHAHFCWVRALGDQGTLGSHAVRLQVFYIPCNALLRDPPYLLLIFFFIFVFLNFSEKSSTVSNMLRALLVTIAVVHVHAENLPMTRKVGCLATLVAYVDGTFLCMKGGWGGRKHAREILYLKVHLT